MKVIFNIIKAAAVIGIIIFIFISCSHIFGKMEITGVETYSYKQIRTEDGKYARINSLGDINGKDVVLVSFLPENGYAEEQYFIARREKKFLSSEYVDQMEILEGSILLGVYFWQGEYVFAVNDPNCKKIRITYSDREETVDVGRIPFVYFGEGYGVFEKCDFFNANGELIK